MRRLEIVRLIAKTKRADLRRESVNDVCDRCTSSQETTKAAWRVYESLTRPVNASHFRRFGATALNLKAP
jgi:hypothetical protein